LTKNPLTLAYIPDCERREYISHVRVLHPANDVATVEEYERRQAKDRQEEHDSCPVLDELEIDHDTRTILGEVRFPKSTHATVVACLTPTYFVPLELQIASYIV
jgi:hypothetical protein